jgi:hypothetical protein
MPKSASTSAPLTADGVDRMYHQLVEIHAIIAAQLAECARWHRTNSTPGSARARTSWPSSDAMPSAIRLTPSLPTKILS